jgi:hypothetical protein
MRSHIMRTHSTRWQSGTCATRSITSPVFFSCMLARSQGKLHFPDSLMKFSTLQSQHSHSPDDVSLVKLLILGANYWKGMPTKPKSSSSRLSVPKVQVMVAHHRSGDADFVQYGHHLLAFGDRGHHGGVEAVPAEQDQRVPVGMCFHLPCSEVRASAVGPLEATEARIDGKDARLLPALTALLHLPQAPCRTLRCCTRH